MNIFAIIKSLLIIYLLLCLAIYVFQRSMIYHPAEATEHDHNTLKIIHEKHTLEALMTHSQETALGRRDVIIYFGGNAENVAYSATDFNQQFPNHSTYLLKYRGYSGAQGSPSEANLFADALTLFDHINQTPNINITIIGRSLGSGIATYLATERAVDKMILITPYDSIRNIAESMFPVFPIAWMLKDQYDSKSRADKITSPTLVVMAKNDTVIPRIHTESLMRSIPQHQLTATTIQAGHNDLDLKPEYFTSLRLFMGSKD